MTPAVVVAHSWMWNRDVLAVRLAGGDHIDRSRDLARRLGIASETADADILSAGRPGCWLVAVEPGRIVLVSDDSFFDHYRPTVELTKAWLA